MKNFIRKVDVISMCLTWITIAVQKVSENSFTVENSANVLRKYSFAIQIILTKISDMSRKKANFCYKVIKFAIVVSQDLFSKV
jgi:hypothetical protein